jgi:hypothetical protein
MKYEDTLMAPELRRRWVERLSQLTLAEHLARCRMMTNSMREVCRAGVQARHPAWSETQVEVEVARLGHRLELPVAFQEYLAYMAELIVEVLDEPRADEKP